MRLYESSGLIHLQQADLAVDKLLLECSGISMTRDIKTVIVLRACDLCSYVCFCFFAILNKQIIYFLEHPKGDQHEVKILIGADKASSDTIIYFEIVAPGIVSYVYNVRKDFTWPGGFKGILTDISKTVFRKALSM